jgi:hypothetical protein
MPPIKSIYSFPAASNNLLPSALMISRATGDGDVCARCRKNSSLFVIPPKVGKNDGIINLWLICGLFKSLMIGFTLEQHLSQNWPGYIIE